MSKNIVVIDYGIGNIFSICNAFDKCGGNVVLSSDKKVIENADRLVLPGVGAFKEGMDALIEKDFHKAIFKFVEKNRPLLGICLGMQMLMDESEEFGKRKGLGIISGKVEQIFPSVNTKIPHIGWSPLLKYRENIWKNTIFESVEPGVSFYFVHSFHSIPKKEENRLAVCNYNGIELTAAVNSGNIFGCQFHPEKSGKNGLKIINRFLKL